VFCFHKRKVLLNCLLFNCLIVDFQVITHRRFTSLRGMFKRRHTSSVQKYSEKTGGNEEKTPEFWVWQEKKAVFCGKCVILQMEKLRGRAKSYSLSDIEIMEL